MFNPDCEGQTQRRREALRRFDRGRASVRRPPTAETRNYSRRAVSTDMDGSPFSQARFDACGANLGEIELTFRQATLPIAAALCRWLSRSKLCKHRRASAMA